MKLHTRRLAIAVGSAIVTALGLLAACSTDNGSTGVPSASSSSGKTSSSSGSSGSTEDGDGGTAPQASPDCGAAPKLRDNTNGFYCAFVKPVDGGSRNCQNTEICCNPGADPVGSKTFPASYCTPKAGGSDGPTACAAGAGDAGSTWQPVKSSTWACADKNGCSGSQKCCMFTWPTDAGSTDKVNIGKTLDTSIPAACGALMAFKAGGSRCADNCNADEIPLCSTSDDNCTGNQKCTPFEGNYRDLAYCK